MNNSRYRQALNFVRSCHPSMRITVERPYTLVGLRVEIGGRRYEAAGLAKCSTEDVWSDEIGLMVARGRAEAQIAKQVAEGPLRAGLVLRDTVVDILRQFAVVR